MTLPRAGSTQSAVLGSVSAGDVSIATDFSVDAAPTTASYYHYVQARVDGSSAYSLTVRVRQDDKVELYLVRIVDGVSTNLRGVTLSSFGYQAGEKVNIRFDVSGSGTTELSAKVWRDSTSEPGVASISASDTTAQLQGSGGVGLKFYSGSGMVPMPYPVRIDSFQVETP